MLANFLNFRASAQVYKKEVLHTGESVSANSYFLFSSFGNANVRFKNGGSLSAKMNFNLLLSQMEFISPAGDTLALSKPEEIDSIYLNYSVFYYNNEYFEIPPGGDSVRLVILRKATYEPLKIGAMGIASASGSGIQTYASLIDKNGEKNLVMNEDISVTMETIYLLLQPDGKTESATKSNFIKKFTGRKQEIESFIKSNKINFNKQSDLMSLLQFCNHQMTSAK